MAEPADWMFPKEWLGSDDVDVSLDYPDRGQQRSYEHLSNKLENVVVEDRPAFLDEWDRITPLDPDSSVFDNTEEKAATEVDFDAAEAFDYCYRSVARKATIYMIHSISSNKDYRPWSPRYDADESYQPPESLFADIVESIPLPETPFETIERGEYESIDQLYKDLAASDKILLEDGSKRFRTTRMKYID